MSDAHQHDAWAERLEDEELTTLITDREQGLFVAQHNLQAAQFKLDRLTREKKRREKS